MNFESLTQIQKNNYLVASIINNDGLLNYWKNIGACLKVESEEATSLLNQILTKDMDATYVKSIISEMNSKYNNTPLMYAIEIDNKELAEKLIPISNINHQNNDGKTALMIAAEKCNMDIVAKLIMKKADINLQDNAGETAIMYAVKAANSNYFEEVMNCISPLEITIKTVDISLIHKKLAIKYKSIINLFLLAHADISIKNKEDKTVIDMINPMDGEYDISTLFNN